MKTVIQLVVRAPSKKAARACLDHLRWAWDSLRRSGDAPANTFLEYGEPKGIRHGKKKKK